MKKYLVTGGAGFIGSNLCIDLVQKGHEVVAMDNLITGNLNNLEEISKHRNFSFIKHDIIKPFNKYQNNLKRLDYILDLACPASPVDFPKHPFEIMDVCYLGTKNLLELTKKNKAIFLQTSTSEVYGDPLEHPQKETYWGNANSYGPRACYDEGKRVAEALIYNYQKKYNLNTKIIRIFNTYGPKMRPDDGRVVSNFIVQAIKGKNITVYGNGSQTRSFCYVTDMLKGINKMLSSKEQGPINIGNPGEFSVLELAKLVKKLIQTKSKIIYKPLPKDDPKKRRPDIYLAKKKLNWQPEVNLEQGLKKSIPYFRKVIK